MKDRLIKLVLLALALAWVPSVRAQSADEGEWEYLCKPGSAIKTVVLFGNGIETTPGDAHVYAMMLKKRVADRYAELEKAGQLETGQTAAGILGTMEFCAAYATTSGAVLGKWNSSDPTLARNDFLDDEELKGDLAKHAASYGKWLDEGKSVIVVAHSNGNFLANKAYEEVSKGRDAKDLHILAVGSPDDHVAGLEPSNDHITLYGDQALLMAGSSLGANYVNKTPVSCQTDADPLDGDTCHDFPNAYLRGDLTGAAIIDAIASYAKLGDPGIEPPDTTPPLVPTGVTVEFLLGQIGEIAVTWNPSTDDSGVDPKYKVYRDGAPVADNISTPAFSDKSIAADKEYCYTVAAFDADGNISLPSAPTCATTPLHINVSLSFTEDSRKGTSVKYGKSATFELEGTATVTEMGFSIDADEAAGCKAEGSKIVCEPKEPGTYTITVTAKDDENVTDTLELEVTLAEPEITIEPKSKTVAQGKTLYFTAKAVIPPGQPEQMPKWTKDEACGGTIEDIGLDEETGLFTAKFTAPTTPGSCTVKVEVVNVDGAEIADAAIVAVEPPAEEMTVSGITMRYVEAGTFMMGCNNREDGLKGSTCVPEAQPKHPIRLTKDFYLGKYEVTRAQWLAVMGEDGKPWTKTGLDERDIPADWNRDQLPAAGIRWSDIQAFIAKLNELEAGNGRVWRLPYEAEWEWAARGGVKSTTCDSAIPYSCGRHIGTAVVPGGVYANTNDSGIATGEVAWYSSNSNAIPDDSYTPKLPHPVGTKLANELGLYDMAGNVSEWVEDFYSRNHNSYSTTVETVDPHGPVDGGELQPYLGLMRGGSANSSQLSLTTFGGRGSAARLDGDGATYYMGFRLALTVD